MGGTDGREEGSVMSDEDTSVPGVAREQPDAREGKKHARVKRRKEEARGSDADERERKTRRGRPIKPPVRYRHDW